MFNDGYFPISFLHKIWGNNPRKSITKQVWPTTHKQCFAHNVFIKKNTLKGKVAKVKYYIVMLCVPIFATEISMCFVNPLEKQDVSKN